MLTLLLTVSAVGVAVGLAAYVARGHLVISVATSIAGAWIGFLPGAGAGALFDLIARSGGHALAVGHLTAALAAILATATSQGPVLVAGPTPARARQHLVMPDAHGDASRAPARR